MGEDRQTRRPVIDEEHIAFIVSRWTGIPVTRLQEAETARLLRMEDELHSSVVGQDEAIKAVSRAIRRSRAGLKDPNRPIGSFVFSGPTGVGKTELARSLAKFLFADASGPHPGGHVGVHGEVLGQPPDRRAPGLRRATRIPAP